MIPLGPREQDEFAGLPWSGVLWPDRANPGYRYAEQRSAPDGSPFQCRRAGLSRRATRLYPRQFAGRHPREITTRPSDEKAGDRPVAADPEQKGLGGLYLAEGMGRPGLDADPAHDVPRG